MKSKMYNEHCSCNCVSAVAQINTEATLFVFRKLFNAFQCKKKKTAFSTEPRQLISATYLLCCLFVVAGVHASDLLAQTHTCVNRQPTC